jgi:hypothetical protein
MFIREALINGNLDKIITKLLNNEKDNILLDYNNIKYEIVTTNNTYGKYQNVSIIKLGECENKLKNKYNISKNESLIIFKTDIYKEGLLIPIVEYEIFDEKNKTQLELKVCKDTKIELLLPCIIDENNLYKYNSSSEYYNDKCYSYSTKEGTDIIISDRRNEYIDNNMSLCEEDCEYKGYDSKNKKSICECEIKLKFPLISEIKINKDKLLNNFKNINDICNLKIMECYKVFFTKEGFIKNIGSYILLFIIICSILSFIFLVIKDYKILNNTIDKIYLEKNSIRRPSNATIINDIRRLKNLKKEEKKKENKKNIIISGINENKHNKNKNGKNK